MARFVGVDYGSNMVKVAEIDQPEGVPTLLRLGTDDPFVPAIVQMPSPGQDLRTGWEAFRERCRSGHSIAAGLRDRLSEPDTVLEIGGRSVDAVFLQSLLLTRLATDIQTAAPDAGAVAVAVPDTWASPHWSLPIALERSGWPRPLFVREWGAVLASQRTIHCEELLMMSLGHGTARATVISGRDGTWRSLNSVECPTVSGSQMRRRLVRSLAEEVINATRKDPREDPEADQRLQDAIEEALYSLHRGDKMTVQVELFGQVFRRDMSRKDLAQVSKSFREPLEQAVEKLLTGPAVARAKCPIIAWGELATLLPISQWLDRFLPADEPLIVAPLVAVALGTARLCALAERPDMMSYARAGSSVDVVTGAYAPGMPSTHGSGAVVWEVLPVSVAIPPTEACPRLSMAAADGQTHSVAIQAASLRLGRHELSDVQFNEDEYPMVSAVHAVIIREGVDYLLKDLGSANGTFVNGKRIKQHLLRPDDEIRLGQHGPSLRFEVPR